jgi:Raf kinase inhibitor-like YbhB/YbcL family protein
MEETGTQREEKAIAGRKLAPHTAAILTVESPSFRKGQPIPDKHAGAHGRSPAMKWSKPPPETRELVVLVEDPDAPRPQPFVHWIVTGLPPETIDLPEGLPPSSTPLGSGAVQGRNGMQKDGYYGPEPPTGHGVHHYHFQVFALDQPLEVRPPVERDRLLAAMRDHVVAWGELVGTYWR